MPSALFTYSTVERDWSADQIGSADEGWVFREYPQGDHGTLMFQAAPEVGGHIVEFLEGVSEP